MFPITKNTLITAIASHLNILESAIAEVQEWAKVLWVRFKQGRPRFVSKKVVEVKMTGINPEKVSTFASWMYQIDIDIESAKESGKWLSFDCDTDSYYPRDIRSAIQNAKKDGFTCFAKDNRCGVLIESVSY